LSGKDLNIDFIDLSILAWMWFSVHSRERDPIQLEARRIIIGMEAVLNPTSLDIVLTTNLGLSLLAEAPWNVFLA
jgi:hypothetical protein